MQFTIGNTLICFKWSADYWTLHNKRINFAIRNRTTRNGNRIFTLLVRRGGFIINWLKPAVRWNEDYETYEHVAKDGYITVFRDNLEAKEYADTHGLKYVE